jgi:hypothetical protein
MHDKTGITRLDPSQVLAYAVSLVTAGFGIAILTNAFRIQVEPTIRVTFGIVFLILSMYRFALTRMKSITQKGRKNLWDE